MKSGELYDSGDTALAAEQTLCLDRLYDYNMTRPTEPKKRRADTRNVCRSGRGLLYRTAAARQLGREAL